MSRWASLISAAAVVAAVSVAAGCSADPAPPPGPGDSSTSAASPTPNPTPNTTPSGAACPDGDYTVSSLKGQGSAAQLGTGTGGNVRMSFDDGAFELSSDGKDPVKLDLGFGSADLRVDGSLQGSYSGAAESLTMKTGKATGTASVKGLGLNREMSMSQLADQLFPSETTARASCAGDQLSLELPNVVLKLTRR